MSVWDRIRAALRREKHDLDEVVDDLTRRGNASLDRRERELAATPEEKMAMEQERSDEIDAQLDEVRRRIEGQPPS